MFKILFMLLVIKSTKCDNSKRCLKQSQMKKLIEKVEAQQQYLIDSLNQEDDKYTKFYEAEALVYGRDLAGTETGCPFHSSLLPKSFYKNCKTLSKEVFTEDATILATFTNGRLGNQMSAFATLYGIAKMAGNGIRVGITSNQYSMLSEVFPYFTENFDAHLISSWYCHDSDFHFCHLNWTMPRMRIHKCGIEELKDRTRTMGKRFSKGRAFYFNSYLNIILIYSQYFDELRNKVFKVSEKYLRKAQDIIDEIVKKNDFIPSALIGIHVRSTDYRQHLKDYNTTMIGPNYFKKATSYFREKADKPLFLVIGDNQETAIELVTKSQENTSDIHFAGTINFGLEGQLTKEESSGIDFATLTLCDHVIVTHGTFGLWGAFLASNTNTHIMANRKMLEEVKEVIKAGLKNFIFMDDL